MLHVVLEQKGRQLLMELFFLSPVQKYRCKTRPCPDNPAEYEIFLLGINTWIDMPCPPGTLYDVTDCACSKRAVKEEKIGTLTINHFTK